MQEIGVTGWLTFLVAGWGTFFTAYLIVQVVILATVKRPYLYWAAIPVPLMALVVIVTIQALLQESNLWPILLIFASPLALLYLLAVGITGLNRQAHPKRRSLVTGAVIISLAACIPYGLLFAYAR